MPTPSNKDYVIRPKWKVEEESERKVIQGLKMKRGYVHIYAHSLFSFSALHIVVVTVCALNGQQNSNYRYK